MFKLQTKISFFRYASLIHTEPLLVTWFKIDNENYCFSEDELELFSDFAKSRPNNFEVLLQFECYENSANFTANSKQFESSIPLPHHLVLTKYPRQYKKAEIFERMEIVLTNRDKVDDHNYPLPFDVLGSVEC
jgi:hypothetical protein